MTFICFSSSKKKKKNGWKGEGPTTLWAYLLDEVTFSEQTWWIMNVMGVTYTTLCSSTMMLAMNIRKNIIPTWRANYFWFLYRLRRSCLKPNTTWTLIFLKEQISQRKGVVCAVYVLFCFCYIKLLSDITLTSLL